MDKRKVPLLIAIELKKAHTYNVFFSVSAYFVNGNT